MTKLAGKNLVQLKRGQHLLYRSGHDTKLIEAEVIVAADWNPGDSTVFVLIKQFNAKGKDVLYQEFETCPANVDDLYWLENMKVFFGWPLPAWRGKVYAVDCQAVSNDSIVVLPDEDHTHLSLWWNEEGILIVEPVAQFDEELFVNAEYVFDTDDPIPMFNDNWPDLLPLINAAAEVNALFTVALPEQEYLRLTAHYDHEFNKLKERMTARASGLVHVFDSYFSTDDQPALVLMRMGSCF